MSAPKRKPQPAQAPIEDLVRDLIDQPDKWLDTENDELGGEKPRDLVGTAKEPVLRNLLEAIKHGSFS
ncbi:MAG TPA: hypothetical protein VGZ47_23620 [Gemmataceae bacterium]|jgi:hypothetical protein|nr:hypothetical protein [Gemmataceae bacterium]